MKKYFCLLCLCSTISGALFDSGKCLPPPESFENLFPRCKEIFGNVEFLYWNVEESALDYAIKQRSTGWAPSDQSGYANGKILGTAFDFNPGVRLLLGFYNAPKYWELFAQYTYFQTLGRNREAKPRQNGLYLVGTFPVPSNKPLLFAKSDVKLNYQIVDAMFSRVFDPNPHLRLRLLAGVSGAFLHQKWKVNYRDDDQNLTLFGNNWHYNAGGLRVGLSADWWWKWGLYFTGKATLAGYSGQYTNQSKINTNYQPSPQYDTSAPVQNLCLKDHRFAPHWQLLIGPSWHTIAECYHLELFMGYELNGWLNLQEVYRSTSGIASQSKTLFQNTSALLLQGLTIRATAGF
jgi:Legionella pneumophila major outer membrane protein precursor